MAEKKGNSNAPSFARTPGRDIFGSMDDTLPEIRIPSDVRMDAVRAAAKEGLDLSAWIRELVYGSLYGPEHVATLHANRIRRVLGNAGQREQVALQVVGEVAAK
jgi:hypothetical protein